MQNCEKHTKPQINNRLNRWDYPSDIIQLNKKIYHDFFDKEYTQALINKLVTPISKIWFRSECIGFDTFPERNNPDKPLIFATNHSGMAFPWDAIIFCSKLIERFKFSHQSVRALVSPMLTSSLFMNPFLVPDLWRKTGCIDATLLNFETMMQNRDSNLLIYPEGVPGIAKGFNKRYQIQELKTSFVRMSIKYKTDIVLFSTINGEYVNPFSYSFKRINKFANKIGLPFLPIGFTTLLVLIQPWIFYISFPAKLTFVMGKQIKAYEMINKPYNEITHREFKQIAARIREQMQIELNNALKLYGKNPYKIGELIKKMIKNIRSFPQIFLAAWPLVFNEYERLYLKNGSGDFNVKLNFFTLIRLFIKRPITLAFFIPIFGWIPIFLKCKKIK